MEYLLEMLKTCRRGNMFHISVLIDLLFIPRASGVAFAKSQVHIDASGKIVRRPQGEVKVVYYYAATIQPPGSQSIVSVTDMVSSNHNAHSIGNWLRNFKEFCVSTNMWPIVKSRDCGGSKATINAILESWNITDLPEYLNTCFDQIIHNRSLLTTPFPGILKLGHVHNMYIYCTYYVQTNDPQY